MVTFVHDRMKFGFIHVPKTGGMTVTRYFLKDNRDARLYEFSPTNRTFGLHSGITRVRRAVGETFDQYYTFAFYRNTYDWLFSLYRYIHRTAEHPLFPKVSKLNFEQYVLEVSPGFVRAQMPLVAPKGVCGVSRLEPYENFAAAFQDILRELGFPAETIRSYNVAEKLEQNAYRSAYTPKMLDMVQELYQDDIEYFGFKF